MTGEPRKNIVHNRRLPQVTAKVKNNAMLTLFVSLFVSFCFRFLTNKKAPRSLPANAPILGVKSLADFFAVMFDRFLKFFIDEG